MPAAEDVPVLDLGPALRAASQRLVRTVDALPDRDWSAPSLLPGWTRAHVVAHLALNAEALAGVLEAAAIGESVPMYASAEGRDADIEEWAELPPSDLRERLLGSSTRFSAASIPVARVVDATGPDVLRREVERHPGGPALLVGAVAEMRLRELEVHHADLDAGYTSADWEPSFAALLVEAMHGRPVAVGDLVAAPDDDARRWVFGAGGTEVAGPLHALAWWLTGRPAAPELRSPHDVLPRIAAW